MPVCSRGGEMTQFYIEADDLKNELPFKDVHNSTDKATKQNVTVFADTQADSQFELKLSNGLSVELN